MAQINLVERWFVALTEKQLRRNKFQSTRELEDAIRRFLDQTQRTTQPFLWTKPQTKFSTQSLVTANELMTQAP
jgi:hypothetical protein